MTRSGTDGRVWFFSMLYTLFQKHGAMLFSRYDLMCQFATYVKPYVKAMFAFQGVWVATFFQNVA